MELDNYLDINMLANIDYYKFVYDYFILNNIQ